MPSLFETTTRAQRLTRTALLAAFGLVMFLFEAELPRPLPWAKPGLANLATLLALYALGANSAWAVTLIRIFAGSLILGAFFSPGFWLSLAGGICSCGVMIMLRRYCARGFSVIGLSLAGALAHVVAQLLCAALLIVRSSAVVQIVPLMLWPALFAVFIVGLAAFFILERFALLPEAAMEGKPQR